MRQTGIFGSRYKDSDAIFEPELNSTTSTFHGLRYQGIASRAGNTLDVGLRRDFMPHELLDIASYIYLTACGATDLNTVIRHVTIITQDVEQLD